jgi:hypothetical protein
MLDRMNPGTTPQKAIIGGLGAVVDIDTWETAGDINRSYQRGDYLQCFGDSQMQEPIGYSGPKKTLDNLVFFIAKPLLLSRWY